MLSSSCEFRRFVLVGVVLAGFLSAKKRVLRVEAAQTVFGVQTTLGAIFCCVYARIVKFCNVIEVGVDTLDTYRKHHVSTWLLFK